MNLQLFDVKNDVKNCAPEFPNFLMVCSIKEQSKNDDDEVGKKKRYFSFACISVT